MLPVHAPLALPDPDATTHLARVMAPLLRCGDTLLLQGEIGTGKTHFARALIQTLAGQQDVPSPTFTLVQTYEAANFDIWHADLYRLTHPDEAIELGLIEAFDSALCLIEWPERLGTDRPKQALTLRISAFGEGRVVDFLSDDPAWKGRLQDV